jgi:hypothetical protein
MPCPFDLAHPHHARLLPSRTSEYKLSKNIKIAMLYLEDDDAVAAEQYIKKASSLLSGCKVRLRPAGGA